MQKPAERHCHRRELNDYVSLPHGTRSSPGRQDGHTNEMTDEQGGLRTLPKQKMGGLMSGWRPVGNVILEDG
jgi:hypothetical protein